MRDLNSILAPATIVPERKRAGRNAVLSLSGAIENYMNFHAHYRCIFPYSLFLMLLHWSMIFASYHSLPDREYEAGNLIEQGQLDPEEWEKVRPYYSQPLSVPDGELQILFDLFPELAQIHGRIDSLDKYKPWGLKEIRQFFHDNSYLRYYRPILSFETPVLPGIGQLGFNFNKMNTSDTGSQQVQFITDPAKPLHASGRADFTHSYARWIRRAVSYETTHWNTTEAGNFSSDFDKSLIYGRIRTMPSEDTSLTDNWIYGRSSHWNGAMTRFTYGSVTDHFSSSALFHHGYTENVYGTFTDWNRGPVTVLSGISEIRWDDFYGTGPLFLHEGLRVDLRAWRMEMMTGFEPRSPLVIPMYLQGAFLNGKNKVILEGESFPRGFHAPMSGRYYSLYRRCGLNDTAASLQRLSSVNFTAEHHYTELFVVSPSLESGFTGNNIRTLSFCTAVSGSGTRMDYSLYYTYTPQSLCSEDSSTHKVSAWSGYSINDEIGIETNARMYTGKNGKWSFTARMQPSFFIKRTIRIEPYVSFTGSNGIPRFSLGIHQRTALFSKTYSDFTFDTPLEGNVYRVKGSIWFFL